MNHLFFHVGSISWSVGERSGEESRICESSRLWKIFTEVGSSDDNELVSWHILKSYDGNVVHHIRD